MKYFINMFIHVTTFVKGAVFFIRTINRDLKFDQTFDHVRPSFNPKKTQHAWLKAGGSSRTLIIGLRNILPLQWDRNYILRA